MARSSQRRASRAPNEQARRYNEAQRQQQRDSQDRARRAVDQARIDQEIAVYREATRAAFPGDTAAFEKAWPRILEEWQIVKARRAVDEQQAQNYSRLLGRLHY